MANRERKREINFRVTSFEKSFLRSRAASLGITQSELLRSYINLEIKRVSLIDCDDADHFTGARCLIYDTKSFAQITRAINRYGHHYNQAVRALNTLVKRNYVGASSVERELVEVAKTLNEVTQGILEIEQQIRKLKEATDFTLEIENACEGGR